MDLEMNCEEYLLIFVLSYQEDGTLLTGKSKRKKGRAMNENFLFQNFLSFVGMLDIILECKILGIQVRGLDWK